MELDFKTGFVAGAASNTDNSVSGIKQTTGKQEKDSFAATLNSARDKASKKAEEQAGAGQANKKEVVKKSTDKERPQAAGYKKDVKERDDSSAPANTTEKTVKQETGGSMEAEAARQPQTPENKDDTKTVGKEAVTTAETTVTPEVESSEAVMTDQQITQMVQTIAEIAGVTVQQAEMALKKLNLTPQELSTPENITKFLVEAKGLKEPAELLKVPELPAMIKGIENTVKTAKEALLNTEAVGNEQAAAVDNTVKLSQDAAPVTPAASNTTHDAKNENTTVKSATPESKEANNTTPAELNNESLEVHTEKPVSDKAAQATQTAQTAEAAQVKPEAGNETDITGPEDSSADGINQGNVNKVTATNQEQKRGNSSTDNQPSSKDGRPFEQQLGATEHNTQDTTVKDNNQTPIVIRQGDETIVEVGGRTISRTPQSAVLNRDVANVINQISEKLKIDFRPNSTEIKINLKPNELGNVTVKILTESGHVTAEIVTENSKVKELVEQSLDTLRQTLKERGVDVGELSVSVGQQENDERMKQFVMEQEKSKGRMSQIISKIDGEETSGPDSINYVKESDFDGSTVHYSA